MTQYICSKPLHDLIGGFNGLWRAGRSTTEQLFNLRILCEKHLQHQQDPYHIFIDFNKAFDRVWHAAFVSNQEEVQHQCQPYTSHKKLYNKAISAVLFNSSTGDWFRTTVGDRQRCLLSPDLFKIFLERNMTDI